MADLGDLLARLMLDSTQWTAGMLKAQADTADSAAKIEGSLGGISESLGKMGEALAGLAVAEGLKTFAEDAIHASDEVGKFRSAMVALKGNGEETSAFLEHIHELAATSPFAFPELAQSAKNMVQMGASMGQVSETMTAITQMGTALKMTGEQVSGIATAMGKLAAGNDPLRVMKSLVGENVPVWQMLAEQLGTNMTDAQAKVKSGAISNDEVIQALTKSMGTYADTADAWGGTWKGAMKGLETETHSAMAAVGDDIKKALNEIGAPAIKAVTETLKEAVEWWKNLSPPVKDALLAFGGAVAVISGVGGALVVLGAAISAIGAPIALAVLGIAAVVAALVGLGEWVNQHWAAISNILVNAWSGISEIWKKDWNDLISDITFLWDFFKTDAQKSWDQLVAGITAIWDGVTAVWKGIWDVIFGAVDLVWQAFKTELSIFDTILGYLLPFWEPIKKAFLDVWNEIYGAISTAWGKVKGIFESATGSGSVLGKLADTFGIVSRATTNVADEMGKTVPKAEDLSNSTKTLTGHLADNNDQITKTTKAHVELQDKFKASKDATAVLWAEAAILNSEFQKNVQFVAKVRVEQDQLAASGKTLADKITDIKIPLTDANAGVEALGKAAEKTMGQISGMSTMVGSSEAALKNLGIESTRAAQAIADKTESDRKQVDAAGDMSSAYDKLMAKQADLKAQIEALSRANGDHKDKLDELQGALKDTTTEITNMTTSTTEAYHAMGLQTVQDIQDIMDKDQDRWDAAKKLADDGNPAMVKQMHQAELDLLTDQKQFNQDWTDADEARRKYLEKELGKHIDTQEKAWQDFGKQVGKDVGKAFDDLADLIITGKGSFGDLMTNMWQSLAKDAAELFLAPLKKGIDDFITNTIGSLLGSKGFGGVSDAIKKFGSDIGGLFSGGGGAPGVPSSVPGLPNVGATPTSPGGAASAGAGILGAGLTSVVSAVSGAISAVTGVIGVFQSMHQETSLNAIEHNTRYTMMYVGDRADGGILGILFKIDEEIAWGANTKATEAMKDAFIDWAGLVTPIFQAIQNQLEGLAPYIVDSKTALEDIRTLATDMGGTIQQGFDRLNITVTATGVTTAEAAKALGDQIAANLSRQLVPVS